nr:serine/threonine-protein phosphatase 6 regulatory ankyrin repeat subunit C-like [Lytechinus pictus]
MIKEDTEDYSPLLKAVKNGHLDEVQSLVSRGANVNQGNAEGWTPLMIAAKTGIVDILKFLRDQGAKNTVSVKGLTALHFAANLGNIHVINYLISQDAEVNKGDNSCVTALHIAALNGHLDAVKYLTSQGAEISDEFYNGNLSPEKALVFYLLENGAKTDVADKSGKLPIHYAKDEVVEQMILSR